VRVAVTVAMAVGMAGAAGVGGPRLLSVAVGVLVSHLLGEWLAYAEPRSDAEVRPPFGMERAPYIHSIDPLPHGAIMATSVFLSLHNERDAARAIQVCEGAPMFEWRGRLTRGEWLALERQGRAAVQRFIDTELGAASVAAILIAGETWAAPWVHYAIQRCRAEGRPMIGIHIHRLADPHTGLHSYKGQNPFAQHFVTGSEPPLFLTELYSTYDWVTDHGDRNLGEWIEIATTHHRHRTGGSPRPMSGDTGSTPRPSAAARPRPPSASSRHVDDEWNPPDWTPER